MYCEPLLAQISLPTPIINIDVDRRRYYTLSLLEDRLSSCLAVSAHSYQQYIDFDGNKINLLVNKFVLLRAIGNKNKFSMGKQFIELNA